MHGWKRNLVRMLLPALLASGAAVSAAERFVPGGGGAAVAGILELRSEATVFGTEVRLKQICRWDEARQGALEGWADLVVARLAPGEAETTIGIFQLRDLLSDAGMGLASVRFAGPVQCAVRRIDPPVTQTLPMPAAERVTPTTQAAAPIGLPAGIVTLKERLTRDLADRLQLPLESLQISFHPQDEKLLRLSEPQFQFRVEPRRARGLGSVSWDVTVTTAGSTAGQADAPQQHAVITGTARAWRDQLVVNRPVSGRQIIRPEDVAEKRALVDSLSDTPPARRDQVIGQQAAMDLKPGTALTGHMVQAVPRARPGQLVTILVNTGQVRVRTVARAVDEGTYGQTIRVRNEQTREQFEVTLTGPQQAEMGGRNG